MSLTDVRDVRMWADTGTEARVCRVAAGGCECEWGVRAGAGEREQEPRHGASSQSGARGCGVQVWRQG